MATKIKMLWRRFIARRYIDLGGVKISPLFLLNLEEEI